MSMGDGSDGAQAKEEATTQDEDSRPEETSGEAGHADSNPSDSGSYGQPEVNEPEDAESGDASASAQVEEEEILFAEVEDDEDVTSVEDALRARISELEEDARNTYQRMLRVAADYENFKRRAEREKEEIRKYGTERLLLDILPVLDNLERAVSHSAKSEDKKSLVDGVSMVQKQLQQALAKYGCESFDSVGLPFDPQKHEAVQQVESAEHDPNTVVEEYHRGYFLNERLIRPAMVVVARRAAGASNDGDTGADSGEQASVDAEPTDGTGAEDSPGGSDEHTDESP